MVQKINTHESELPQFVIENETFWIIFKHCEFSQVPKEKKSKKKGKLFWGGKNLPKEISPMGSKG